MNTDNNFCLANMSIETLSKIRQILNSNIKYLYNNANNIIKMYNNDFDILIENNDSIIVVDKRDPQHNIVYKNLDIAFSNLRFQFQRNDERYQTQLCFDSMGLQRNGG